MLRTIADPQTSGIKIQLIQDQKKAVINGWTVVAYRGDNGERYERLHKGNHVRWMWLEQDELFSKYGDEDD